MLSYSPKSRSTRQSSYHQALSQLFFGLFLAARVSASTQDVSNKVSERATAKIPLVIENLCPETIWPAFASQAGTGPSTGGFELATGAVQNLTVSPNWQGRVWGRTNCSFNAAGTGASNLNGNNGAGQACVTGDCNGKLSCVVTGDTPVTLAEFDLAGGVNNGQTFYDLSLVDGYNLPIGLTYLPGNASNLLDIPPNLTNAACIGTTGFISDAIGATNASFPMPFDTTITDANLANWCPWDLQLSPPTKPGDGVYPYPDDNIQRPVFAPCLSACAKTNAPSDCCTGSYDSPSSCKPSLYSSSAKAVCPDAYSYAFDDTTSTFIIPTGGGWKVTFCPAGKSTNILKTFGTQLSELASSGSVSPQTLADSQNITIVMMGEASGAEMERMRVRSLGALVVMLAWACMW